MWFLHYRQFNFVTFFDFRTQPFWGLNTTKVHYRGYLVCTTPPTVLKFLIFFIKAYVVGTHLNCIDKSNEYPQHLPLQINKEKDTG